MKTIFISNLNLSRIIQFHITIFQINRKKKKKNTTQMFETKMMRLEFKELTKKTFGVTKK